MRSENPNIYLERKIANLFGKNLVSIILFGSFARGNYNEFSDIDIIVITEEYDAMEISNLRKMFLVNFERKLDIHIFSKEEFVQNLNNFSPLLLTLLLGKKILLDKEMFFQKEFEKFIKNIVRENINFKYCEEEKIWKIKEIAQNFVNLQ